MWISTATGRNIRMDSGVFLENSGLVNASTEHFTPLAIVNLVNGVERGTIRFHIVVKE